MKRKISIKSFEKTITRFENLVIKYLNESPEIYANDIFIKGDMGNEFNYNVKLLNTKLIETYKRNISKKKSAFIHKTTMFQSISNVVSYIKVAYEIDDEQLVFKFSIKYKGKFKRKIKFVLNIT